MSTLKKLLKLFSKKEQKEGSVVLFFVLGMALLDTAGVASLMPFLAVIGDPELINTNQTLKLIYEFSQGYGVKTSSDFLILLGFGSFMLLIISAAYRTFTQYKMNRYIEMMRHSLSARLLENYLGQPYEFFMTNNTSNLSKSTLSEVDQLVSAVLRPVFSMFAYSMVGICMFILLATINPFLLLISSLVLGGAYILIFRISKPILDRLGKLRTSSNAKRYLIAQESLTGIRDLKLLGRELTYINRFDDESSNFAHTVASNLTLNRVPKYIVEAIAFGGIIAIVLSLIISGNQIESNALGRVLPMVGLYAFAAYRLQPALHFIFSGFASLRFGKTAVDSVYKDLLQYESESKFNSKMLEPISFNNILEIKNLYFRYLNTDNDAIKDITFSLNRGEMLGIVGPTGCGKSTLVNLLIGLLRVSNGSIAVDGNDITPDLVKRWQRSIGYVPQDIFLTDNTIAENIAFGVPKNEIDYDQVRNCACLANIDNFIKKELPLKYETIVGERGVRLSGGQKQRIGIARALYNNPEILIFDEATSALDSVVEKTIMEAIDFLSNEKTIILIAHRMNTVKRCNNILLMNSGRIEASGNYDELYKSSKRFQKMVNS